MAAYVTKVTSSKDVPETRKGNAPQESILDQIDLNVLPEENVPNEFLGFRVRITSDTCDISLPMVNATATELDITLDMPQGPLQEQRDKAPYWRIGSPLIEFLSNISFTARRHIKSYLDYAAGANEVWQDHIKIFDEKADFFGQKTSVVFRHPLYMQGTGGPDEPEREILRVQIDQVFLPNQDHYQCHLPICIPMTPEEQEACDRQLYRQVK